MPIDKIAALRRTALFGRLEVTELSALADKATEVKLAKNEILFIAGEPARGLYVVVEGAVRAYRVGADGREQIIHVEQAGATFAEVPVFDEGNYPSNVAGEEDSIVLYLDKREIQRLCLEFPQISLAALRLLASRLRKCASLVETLSLHDVDRRLANLLLEISREKGTKAGRGVVMDMTMTHQQIATRIGTVREVVSRAFSRLQQAGHIQVDGKKLTIADLAAFQNYAG